MNLHSLISVSYGYAWYLLSERKRLRELEATIAAIRSNYTKVCERGMELYARIYNVALFTLILEYDFAILKYETFVSVGRWKRYFIARQLALFLYEASDDLPSILGKDFRYSLECIGITKQELGELDVIGKTLSNFRKKHSAGLKDVRDITAAHRHHNASELLLVIERSNPVDLMKIAGDYYQAIRNLITFLIKIVSRLGDWKVVIKHIDINKIPLE